MRALQRRAPDRRDDRARRPARRLGARHRPLRPPGRRRRGPAARRRRRPRQGPGLHARRPAPGGARAAALPARRADQAARSASSPPPPASGRRQGREPGPLLPRRRGKARLPRPPRRPRRSAGRDRRQRRAGASVEHPGHHDFTVGQRRGLGLASARAPLRARHRRGTNRVVVGGASSSRPATVHVRDATLHRPGGRVDSVSSATARRAARRASSRAGRRRASTHELELELDEPAYGAAPGQTAVLMSARPSSVGPRSPIRLSADLHLAPDGLRRDPRDIPVVLRAARPPARAVGVAGPGARRHLDPAHVAGMQPFKPYFLGREQPPAPR